MPARDGADVADPAFPAGRQILCLDLGPHELLDELTAQRSPGARDRVEIPERSTRADGAQEDAPSPPRAS